MRRTYGNLIGKCYNGRSQVRIADGTRIGMSVLCFSRNSLNKFVFSTCTSIPHPSPYRAAEVGQRTASFLCIPRVSLARAFSSLITTNVSTVEELLKKGDSFFQEHHSMAMAQSYYEQALQQHLNSSDKEMSNTFRYCQILNKLGCVHARTESYEDAMNYFQQALNLFEKQNKTTEEQAELGEEEEVLQAAICNGIGAVLASQDQRMEALIYFEKAALVLRYYKDSNNIDISARLQSVCENIGQLYLSIQDYTAAQAHLKEALRISQRQKHLRQPQLYIKLGDCYSELNEHSLSVDMYEEAYSILLQKEDGAVVEGNEQQTIITMKAHLKHHIGLECAQLGLYGDAMIHFKKSVEIQCMRDATISLADTYNAMGAVCATQQQWEEAFTYFNEALVIYQQHSTSEVDDVDSNIMQTKRNLALVRQKQEKQQEQD